MNRSRYTRQDVAEAIPMKARQVDAAGLTEWLNQHHWSMYALAEALGVTVRTVNRWADGQMQPAPYLGLALNELHKRIVGRGPTF